MNIQALGRAVAFIALASALLAAATTLSSRKDQSLKAAKTELPAAAAGAVNAELARCRAIGPEAANDALCRAVWEDNRKRFLEIRKAPPGQTNRSVPGDSRLAGGDVAGSRRRAERHSPIAHSADSRFLSSIERQEGGQVT
jgi:conjugative transfer region protein TrbK